MTSKRKAKSWIAQACRLTGSNWAAQIYLDGHSWLIKESAELGRVQKKELLNKIQSDGIENFATDTLLTKKTGQLDLGDFQLIGANILLAFPVSSTEFILVGSSTQFKVEDLDIWNFLAKVKEPEASRAADEQVDLLQNTVLELQLTQQELQARITAQKEAEARLIQAAKLAAVGEMAAGVAHELNNPLTSVVGFTELALEELPQGSSIRSDLELVLQEARRAMSVVRRLLDFARQTETIRVMADLNEIVEDVLLLTRHQLEINHVQVDVRLKKELKWAMVDRNQIKQVIINLINNAMYAMPDGGQVRVETSEQTRYGRSWITISVRDTGIGIPPENLERIFEPFFSTRADRGGTGLGLSVTYGIITDHGGMIEVESQQQVGSTFVVWLPLDQPE